MFFAMVYAVATLGLAVYGFNALIFVATFIWLRRRAGADAAASRTPPPPGEWPAVAVQLPIYNERFVVERLIEAAAALDYPADRLTIQVLDDSTDDTAVLARARVAHHKARGLNIEHLQRPERRGYKAGALAYGLARTGAEFVAVFDADFIPPPDFLRRTLPHFADPQIGMAQTRWGHLNAEHSLLTRAQAMMLDGHFGIEQTVRSQTGLLFNFNGSAGVWRKTCIEDAGGWGADTIAEDLDLSYRAQLRGWRLHYLPDVVAPAEIPSTLGAFKRQQFRWAKGSIQCLRKVSGNLLLSPKTAWQKLQGLLHLAGYLVHPLMLILILMSLPMMLNNEFSRLHMGAIGLAGLGAPIMFGVAQWALYPDWRKRLLYLPALIFVGAGLAVNNTWAIVEAVIGRNPTLFLRTPKLHNAAGQHGGVYSLPVDWTTWAELFFAFYTALTTLVAFEHAPGLAPFMALYAIGFGYTATLGLWQSFGVKATSSLRGAVTME
jgi:cellulose synthase/poly-beta-1,6-N-acetylglucosamine synthase-like glycosyltransferase